MAVRRFAEDHALVAMDAWPIRALGVYCVAFATTPTGDLDALIAMLANDGRVDLVEANHSFEGMITARPTYDDPLFELQYGEFRARVETLHAISTGQHVKLGLIDSSVDLEHPDLAGQIARQTELVPGGEVRQRIHGTAVAGVIGATPANGLGVVGLAPAAELRAYGACTSDGDKTRCSAFALAKALEHAIDDRLHVLNISLAGPENRLLAALIDRALADGMIVIAAANAADPARNFPASAPGVIAASADDPLWFARPEQLSTQAGGGYQVFFGSSVASAGMAGLAALVRAHSSAQSTRDLLEWLATSRCAEGAGAPMPVAFDVAQLCH
jgi:subtilisin family serine protease